MSWPARGTLGPVWPQPGHPGIDQPGVEGLHVLRTVSEPFHHPRPEALDQDVGPPDETHDRGFVVIVLQVRLHHGTPAQHPVGIEPGARQYPWPLNAHNIGTQIGQHHRSVRPRAHSRELDHPYPVQRTTVRGVCSRADIHTEH
jgi:hypothetical protein